MQYRWGRQTSGIADIEGKGSLFFACQQTAGNSPLSQLIIRNGSLHNDWKLRKVKGEDEFSGQQSGAWFPELERVLSSENTGVCELPWLPWFNTAWPVSRILHLNGGQAWQTPTPTPRICLAIRPARGQGLGGPSGPHYADLVSLSSSFLPRHGDSMDTETGKHKDTNWFLSPLPCLPPSQKMHSYKFRIQNGARMTTYGLFVGGRGTHKKTTTTS